MNDIQQLMLTALTNSPNRNIAEQELLQILTNHPEQFRLIGEMIISNSMQELEMIKMIILLNSTIRMMQQNSLKIGESYKKTLFEIYTAVNVTSKQKQIIKSSIQKLLFDGEYYQAFAIKMKVLQDQQLVCLQIFKLLFDFLIFDQVAESKNHCAWFSDFLNDFCRALKSTDIQDYLEFLQTLEECFCVLFKCDKQDYIPFQNVVYQNQEISQLLLGIFQLNNSQNLIVEEIKISALKCYQHLVVRMFQSRNKEQQIIFPIYFNHSILLPHFIQSLQFNKNNKITQCIIALLDVSIKQKEFYNLFQSCYRDLIEQTLQYLIFSESQIQSINDDSQLLNDYFLNFDEHSQLIHVKILQFLNSIASNLDGASTYLAQFSIIIFKFSVNQIQQIHTFEPQEIAYIENIKNKYFSFLTIRSIFQEFNAKQRLQAIFLLLISLFPLLKQRYDIYQYMSRILDENLEFFMLNSEQLLQCLYCKFVDISFQCSKSMNQEYLSKFLNTIKIASYKNKDAYFYQVIQTLNTIMKYNREIINPLFDDLITYYSASLISTKDIKIFQLFEEWISQYQIQFETQLIIAAYAAQRILNGEEIIVDFCWNLLMKIASNLTNFDYLIQLEQKVLPIYKQFYLNENVSYSEKLIQFLTLIISKIQRVTLEQSQLLPAFEKILKQQGYVFHELFDLLNNYMYYGREYFLDENSQLIVIFNFNKFFKLTLENLTSTENEAIEKCEGALLIQLGIQCLRSDIKENILRAIFETAFQMLTQQMEEILSSRILCIFLSALLTVKSISEKILGDSYDRIKSQLFGMNYSAGYDTKLFIIFYSNCILQNPSLLVETGSIIVSMLSYQMEQDNDEKFYMPDDEFEEDELACQEFDQEEEKKILDAQIIKFKSGYVGVDEFETFKLAIREIKQKNPNIINQFKQSLHAFTLLKLQQVLSSTRAQFEKPRQVFIYIFQIFKVNKRKQI